jgi:O-antigen/teichoic acid export membrane protein
LMIGSMVGLSMVGVYYFYFYIASILYVPMRALSRISVPIIATAWKENNLEEIRDIYRRTSVIQLIIGSLLYVGIIINKHNLFFFVKNAEYSVNFIFFMIIGLGVMIDISVGLNSEILVNSPDYRYDSFFNVMLLIVSVVSTYILIPISGGIGAALGFVASYFTFNFLKWIFLYRRYKLQPFDYKQLIVVISAVLIYFVGSAVPVIDFVFLDIAVRSSIVTLIFGTLMLAFKISPDLNERFTVYKSLVLKRFK